MLTVEDIRQRKDADPDQILTVRFSYDGVRRELDNVSVEKDGAILVGFEMRKSGAFSYKVKRFKAEKISSMYAITSPDRNGPVIGR